MDTNSKPNVSNKIQTIIIIVLLVIAIIIVGIIIKTSLSKTTETIDKVETYDVSFEKNQYTCEVGKEIEVVVTPNGKNFSNDIVILSSDNSVATIDNNSLACNNCKKVKIECKNSGTVELKAMYDNKILATSGVSIEKTTDRFSFEQNSYSCRRGEVIEVNIKAGEGRTVDSIKRAVIPASGSIKESIVDFKNPANNTEKELSPTVEIDDKVSSAETCANCKKIRVKCFYIRDSENPVELKAETTDGQVATTRVYYDNYPAPVHFGTGVTIGVDGNQAPPTSISCMKKVHITSQTLVFETDLFGENAKLKRLYTDDNEMAEVQVIGRMGNPSVAVEIYCKNKAGRVDIFAEAADGSVNVLRVGVINQDPPTGPPSNVNPKK